ncbi:L,D-transpeptidase-like protein [Terracoccus luteus]|uniref:L,D-transpeptidase-like protein n=1 Tax=Terracoccus luteus TaxID=53356 RepID=A0A495XV93_9MICO|nr:peptidoglycan-binding protein [Terracoccus luteus]RKT77439.1 L,D-transpeptidase-like protein [Terracoccus luteus]
MHAQHQDTRTRVVRLPATRLLAAVGTVALGAGLAACGPAQSDLTAGPTAQTSSTPADGTPATTEASPSSTSQAPLPTRTAAPAVATVPAKPVATASATTTRMTRTAPTSSSPAPVVVLQVGDNGPRVRSMQARLKQLGWFSGDVTDQYGPRTSAAVKGFQAKRGFDVTGSADERTYERILSMSRKPSADELANVDPTPTETAEPAETATSTPTTTKATATPTSTARPSATPAPTRTASAPKPKPSGIAYDVDSRCLTGRVMCISKTDRSLTWVVDGVAQYRFDVRFGSDELPTREGTFSVYKKKVDVISNLYHTPMPYSMFFSGGQAVHYSSNFARLGYSGASHGCVNVRDKAGVVRLYEDSRVGDKVVIHW